MSKVEINLELLDSGRSFYWNGGAFVAESHLFPPENAKKRFDEAVKAAVEQFGEQEFKVEMVHWGQTAEIGKGEIFNYAP